MITEKDVRKIAGLSKLELSNDEIVSMTSELSQILKFVEKLNELDLTGVEATAHAVSMNNVFREDVAIQSPVRDKALAEAPQIDGTLFRVPKVI